MSDTPAPSDNRFLMVMAVLVVALILIAILMTQGGTAAFSPSPSPAGPLTQRTNQPFAPTNPYLSHGQYFDNVTVPAGLIYQRQGTERLIGQAWGDVDGDGWLDLYVTDHAGPNRLYQNMGDGTFRLHPWADAVSLPTAESSGAIFVDYDNDGRPDLLVLNWGANHLFRNTGQGFEDVTEAAGLAGDTGHGKTASWGDYDNDGHLDLYIANWSCSPRCGRPMQGDRDTLYHNNGDGTFTDVTIALLGGTKTRGAGFIATFVDYDNDGDLDIYLVNDEFINPIGNMLWRNDGPGCGGWCFTEVASDIGANTRAMGMGLATADYDLDGQLDFYFSNAGPMFLLRNEAGSFRDVAVATGTQLGRDYVGWGAIFFDYDNDGWPDLYLAISDYLGRDGRPPADILFRNNREGGFDIIPPLVSGLDKGGRSLGVAYADYDNDGWLDMVVGYFDGNYQLFHNTGKAGADHGRLAVQLIGGGDVNRDAIGARVTLELSDGRTLLQEVKAGSSLGAGDSLILHFGLGQATVRQLTIRWPNGTQETHPNIPINQRLTFHYQGR